MDYDAIVVGAGHNGLIAAAYLARAGLNVVVLEEHQAVGGAAVTEELIPGFKVSTASYSLSLLRPDIYKDLELRHFGLAFSPKDPQMFVPLPDGRHFFVWRDSARTAEEIAKIHPPDADGYRRFGAFWEAAVALLRPLAESDDPPRLGEVEKYLRNKGREDVWRLAVAGSVAETVEEFFESDELRGAFASQGIIGTAAGPRAPGTAWVMAYHSLGGELNGSTGTWAYVRGGMGSVTSAIAASALEAGATILTDSKVDEILVERGRAVGVRLDNGDLYRAEVVLSNADPKRTFSQLVPSGCFEKEFTDKVGNWNTKGSVVKVNLALSELPDYRAVPGTAPGPQHFGTLEVSPSVDYLERAWNEAASGAYPSRPFMEVFIQSATDASLAPHGAHVLSAFTQWAPQGADPAQWGSLKDSILGTVLETIGEYAPNVPDAVIAHDVLGPPELEERFGLTGGNIFHGEILPEQSFGERFSYKTPLPGLYLCGSGASPGGGVMGAAGRNCARRVLAEQRLTNGR